MKLNKYTLAALAASWKATLAERRERLDSTGIICQLALDALIGLDPHEPVYDDSFVQLDAGHRPWGLKLPDLKAIPGLWTLLPENEMGDVMSPDWSRLGLGDSDGELSLPNSPGVNYVGDEHMVIVGYNGDCCTFWVYEKV